MPSLRQIRYFLTVADQGNLTAAANQLFVAQPALSRQIALLENELGFALFDRNPRGVTLTAAGKLYRDRVRTVERQLGAAAEESARLAHGHAGVLRLLHSSSIPIDSLLPSIRRFLADAPSARIDLDRISSESQIDEVAAGRADIGLIRLPVLHRDPTLQFIELPAEPLYVALPNEHPRLSAASIRLADLAEESFVSAVHRERGGLARRVADLCLTRGFVPKLGPAISRKTSMLDLVAAGFGIAIVPQRMTGLVRPGLHFRPLDDTDAHAGLAIILPPQPTALASRFAEALRADCTLK
ncbi:LysR family transcriptional regulator [Azonexus sp. IMCC34839]|uniref:LysR family transcriptional regulator n=1 Tax=Azonexus sp. IMCC34839 TaxID=3133695 RepID=UPI003999C762